MLRTLTNSDLIVAIFRFMTGVKSKSLRPHHQQQSPEKKKPEKPTEDDGPQLPES